MYLCGCSLSLQQIKGCGEDTVIYFIHDDCGLNINKAGSTIILAPSLLSHSADNAVFLLLITEQERGRISVKEQNMFGL
jgi:hypothetical protein